MLKKHLVATLILLLSLTVNAQKLENALLWKISGNGLSEPSYLFGTIHITCDAALDTNVLNALNDTKQLYLELDMDDPDMQAAMMGGMMMKDGVTMSSLASEEDFKLVDDFIKSQLGISVKLMDNFKPSLVGLTLYPLMLDCPMQSIEKELMAVTQQQQEEIYGLETVEEQMAVFDAIPYEEQMKELVETARDNMASEKKLFKKMMDVYKTKNLNAIVNLMKEEENKMLADHADVLLANRNKNWIPKMEAAAKATPTFFGVGAAHLPGEDGVIMLLRKKGYKIEAVK